ncbi:hypothetical protein RG963_05125 [Methanosarcina sp. Z-7115]|uniref:Uncharacterized protein n=1 Tax=Methanosarcina baikalica TaxID=3073890 RepID=A0ABU2CZL0_9EURY|nr:hypothetical protein [Methanosarcina sp. Z-7115]MDR7665175.1 hypothetical protein [Methanosarcina sp. Z-7115]
MKIKLCAFRVSGSGEFKRFAENLNEKSMRKRSKYIVKIYKKRFEKYSSGRGCE